jgi:hypothetical protein
MSQDRGRRQTKNRSVIPISLRPGAERVFVVFQNGILNLKILMPGKF